MKKFVEILFNNYCGLFYIKIGNKIYHGARVGRIMLPFIILWGIISIITEGEINNFSLTDIIFSIFFIIQVIFSFTNILVKKYMKLFNLTVEDLKEIDKKRNEEAHKKLIKKM
jgi:hypothetical protein